MGCLMSLVLFSLRRSYPKSIKGLSHWSVFPFLAFVASVLYAMQGLWHHLISMALPNLLVVLTLTAQTRGTFKHFGRPTRDKTFLGLILVASIFVVWTSGKPEYFVHRLVFVSSLTALMYGSQLRLLWNHRKGSFAAHFMLLTLVSLCAVVVLRAVTALTVPTPVGIYNYSTMQALYLASFAFGVLLLSISAILLATEQLRGEMEKLLKHDSLTGALTRRAAFEYGANELARGSRVGAAFSVLLLDLDHFKQINDQFGHQVGDRVLTDFVRSVETVLRRPAAVGRYGGEEFLVLLPDTDKDQAMQVAQRIQSHLHTQAAQPKLTVSIGVATHLAGRDTLDSVIGRADAAMYTAKRNGRDRIEVEETGAQQ